MNAALGAMRAQEKAGDIAAAAASHNQALSSAKGRAAVASVQKQNPTFAALVGYDPFKVSTVEPETDTRPGPKDDTVAAPTPVGVYTKREKGGWVRTYERMSDGSQRVIDEYQDRGAGESVQAIFEMAGLGKDFAASLMAVIDGVYNDNITPTAAQILSSVYNSDAYKTRFKANVTIQKRLSDGQGRAGDRMLTPKEYIDAEAAYATILSDSGMPTGYYDSPDDFTTLIGNSVSVSEFKSRVDTAYLALNFADEYTMNSLQNYYNLSKGDLVAYLLDPARATPILEARELKRNEFGLNDRTELQKMYETSTVGGMASRVGLSDDKSLSEDIVQLGKTGQAEAAFKTAAEQAPDVNRLGKLYNGPLDFKDLVKESLSLSGGIESGRKRKKFVGREKAAFGSQGALDKTSLSKVQDV
jgi:hypothetical protein